MRHTLSAFMELGPMKIRLKQVTLPRQIRIAVILNTKDDDCNKKCALTTPRSLTILLYIWRLVASPEGAARRPAADESITPRSASLTVSSAGGWRHDCRQNLAHLRYLPQRAAVNPSLNDRSVGGALVAVASCSHS